MEQLAGSLSASTIGFLSQKYIVQSIIEYGAAVWNQNRITINYKITLALKKVTRIALNIHYAMDSSRYINYEKRCEILSQGNPTTRRRTQAASLCVKILKGELKLSFSSIIINHLNTNIGARIYRPLRPINRDLVPKSPVVMLMVATTYYERSINLNLSVNTIMKKIKEYNSE